VEEFKEDENVFIPLQKGFSRYSGHQGRTVREMYSQYFNHDGKAEWQNKIIR
jgi:hypothetical protein